MSAQTDEQIADQVYGGVFGNRGDSSPANTTNSDDAIADKLYSGIKMQNAVQARSANRQWLGPQFAQQAGKYLQGNKRTPWGDAQTVLNGVGTLGQGMENAGARVADALLPGKQAEPDVDQTQVRPMEFGDVAAARGANEPLAQNLGFLGSMAANPINPARPVGAAVTAGSGMAGNAARQAALKGVIASAPLYTKPVAAMQHLADNPNIYDRETAENISGHGSDLGNKIAAGIQSIGKTARSLYQKAYTNGNSTPVNPHVPIDVNGTDLVTSLQNRLMGDSPETSSAIANAPLWKEPANANSMSMTHTYVPPRNTGILDQYGNELTDPGQHSATGVVTSKEGANTSKEMQHFVTDPSTGQQRIAAVRTVNSTSDTNPLRTVTVNDVMDRLKSGQPVTVSQLGAMHKTLNGMGMATSGGMASDVSKVLAQHDGDFAKADSAWQSYSRLKSPAVAGNLFGGISSEGNAGDQTGTKILDHFRYPTTTDAYKAPSIVDSEFSKFGLPANYTKQVKDLSSIDGLSDLGPHGHFAQASLLPVAADVLGEHLPGAAGAFAAHPAVAAVAGLGAIGVNALSSKGISAGLIRALSDKGILNRGAGAVLKSPAAKYMMNTINPATMGIGAGLAANQQSQENQQQ